MARTVYWISPHPKGWQVKRERASAATNVFPTKAAAIERARELAHNNQPSQIKVQRSDGTIETEWTYGQDPYPPSG